MTQISFHSSLMSLSMGLMAYVPSLADYQGQSIPIPQIMYSLASPNIFHTDGSSMAKLQDYGYLSESNSEYTVVSDAVRTLLAEPSDLDVEMARMLTYDVWELF